MARVDTPIILVLNQIDQITLMIFQIASAYQEDLEFDAIILFLALLGNNVAQLVETIEESISLQGQNIIPDDQLTDHPEYFIVSELIREKFLELTEEEIPYQLLFRLNQ